MKQGEYFLFIWSVDRLLGFSSAIENEVWIVSYKGNNSHASNQIHWKKYKDAGEETRYAHVEVRRRISKKKTIKWLNKKE